MPVTFSQRKYQREYFKNNREKCNAACRRSYQKAKKTPARRFLQGKSRAKSRGTDFTISLPEYKEIIDKPCFYCSSDLSQETGFGLDRIDNDGGYTLNNVLPCCGSCNKIRGDNLTVEEMKVAMQAILSLRSTSQAL